MTGARAHRDPTALLEGVSEQHSQNPSHRRNGREERQQARGEVVTAQGKLHYRETLRDGLDNTLDAFLPMTQGENVGKR
jgi:hypothetical protein